LEIQNVVLEEAALGFRKIVTIMPVNKANVSRALRNDEICGIIQKLEIISLSSLSCFDCNRGIS
jgi:hypothetical protein